MLSLRDGAGILEKFCGNFRINNTVVDSGDLFSGINRKLFQQEDEIIDLDESDEVEAVISSEEDTENDNSSSQFKEDTDDSLSIPLIDLTDDGPDPDVAFVSSSIKVNGPKMIKF